MHLRRHFLQTCLLLALSASLSLNAALQPPPQPEKMSEIQRAAAIAIYEDLIENSRPVRVGDPETELTRRLGKPDGTMTFGSKKRVEYEGGYAMVSGGKIIKLDGIPAELLAAPDVEAYTAYQKALGKVHYMGRWMTPEESMAAYQKSFESRERELQRISRGQTQTVERANRIAREQAPWVDIRRKGARISEQELIVRGRFTVVDFYADWCGPCKAIEPYLKQLAEDPRIVIRKVDIVNWNSPVARQWNLKSIPNMRVYDPNGRQLGGSTSDLNQIITAINNALAGR